MSCSRLTGIELYAFNHRPSFCEKPLAAGTRYVVLRLSCRETVSCAGCEVPAADHEIDLIHWGAFLRKIRGLTLPEAADVVESTGYEWPRYQRLLVHSALEDMIKPRARVLALVSPGKSAHSTGCAGNTSATFNPDTASLIAESVSYYSILSCPHVSAL